jgi:hypothetical protein
LRIPKKKVEDNGHYFELSRAKGLERKHAVTDLIRQLLSLLIKIAEFLARDKLPKGVLEPLERIAKIQGHVLDAFLLKIESFGGDLLLLTTEFPVERMDDILEAAPGRLPGMIPPNLLLEGVGKTPGE